jgi:hypothetical protein
MSCENTTIIKGSDWTEIVYLKRKTGAAYTGASGGGVTAHFVDKKDAGTINGNTVTQADSGGASWAIGTVEVVMSATDTAALTEGNYWLQVNVTESGGSVKKMVAPKQYKIRSAS